MIHSFLASIATAIAGIALSIGGLFGGHLLGAQPAITSFQGGTGSSSPSGILYGDGSIGLKTVIPGANCTFAAGTFNCTGGGGAGTGTVSTSTGLVSGQVDFSTGVSTIGNDATFLWDNVAKLFKVLTGATTTRLSAGQAWFGETATSSFSKSGALTLATALTVANGGTGQTTLGASQLLYGQGTGGVQAVATTSLTATSPLSLSQTVVKVGGSDSVLSLSTAGTWSGNAGTATALAANGANCSSGNAPLGVDASGAVESCFDVWTEAENTAAAYAPQSRTLTVAGTSQQITSSAGAQDLSANRTWTLSLPNYVLFPNGYSAAIGSTTNATSTNLTVTGAVSLFGGAPATTANALCIQLTGSSALCDGDDASGGGGGSGTVATSSLETAGQLPYWTTTSGFPAKLGSVATTTHSFSGPFSIAGTIGALVGGTNSTVTWWGLATSSNLTAGQLLMSNGAGNVSSVATTSAACSGFITCTGFNALGAATTITTTGQLSIASGGTNAASFGTGSPIYFNGTSLVASSTKGIFDYIIGTTTATSTFLGGIKTAALQVTGLTAASCDLKSTTDGTFYCGVDATGGGGGSGSVATSTNEVSGQVPVFSSNSATPATIRGYTTFLFDGSHLGVATTSQVEALTVGGNININKDATYKINNATVLAASSSAASTLVGFGAGSALLATSSVLFGYGPPGNTIVGYDALKFGTSTYYNTAVGYHALYNGGINSTSVPERSAFNTAVGYDSMEALTTGTYNAALGSFTLWHLTTGDANVAIGDFVAGSITTGSNNIALGNQALAEITTGIENVGIGVLAGSGLSANNVGNVEVGGHAGEGFGPVNPGDPGDANIFLGYKTLGQSLISGNGNIFIGSSLTSPLSSITGTLNIGNVLFGNGLYYSTTTFSSSPTSNGVLAIGTSTALYAPLTLASSTGMQLLLADGSKTASPWFMRSINGNFYLGTSSPSTFATTTRSVIGISSTGTTTITGPLSATSTQYVYSSASGKGGAVILEDEGGGACTQITTKAGTVKGAVVVCPNEL